MDCEKFDRVVLDLLYGELDELTDAAARRHVDHCSRCKGIASGLRATREVGALALVDPPDSLELGILAAERQANERLPLTKKVGRAVSILAVYAMRPQLAMAALLLLMIGSSLFFLRARPSSRDSVLVTERGVPESEADHVVIPAPPPAALREVPTPASPPRPAAAARGEAVAQRAKEEERAVPSAAASVAVADEAAKGAAPDSEGLGSDSADDTMAAASAAFQGGRYVEAQRRYEELAARGGSDGPAAALQAVEALRRQRGCPAAAPRYDEVHSRYRETPSGSEAAWQAGDCYRALGDLPRARQSLESLLDVPEYRARAQAALQELSAREEQLASAKKAKASAPAAAPLPATPPAEAKPTKPGASQGDSGTR
jgi:tetratricopeptide (TPR) repeat protein